MSIAPVRCSMSVKAPPARAFEFFARDIGRWWPKDKTIGASPPEEIVMEPRAGGRWFERAQDGTETAWGKVLAWEPPARLVLAWQIDASWKPDPNFQTEVEVVFRPEGTGTLVTLEHRNLERFGDSAEKIKTQISGGWPAILNRYSGFSAKHASDPSHSEKEKV
ncbi:MAG: SRPBCC family protein [Methylobacteriaceae bacterium]|nr:SRPBCC family protein [Methylobacteriaceae bacterium]